MLQPQMTAGGWMEALFARQPKPIRQLEDIQEENYELAGGPVPLQELQCTYDMYVMLHERRFFNQPRAPRHGDVVLLCKNLEQSCAYALMDPNIMKTTLRPGVYGKLQILAGQFPLGLLRLPQHFRTFAHR